MRSLLVAFVCLGIGLSGCVLDSGRCLYPIHDVIAPSGGASTSDVSGGGGSCPAVVVIDGEWFRDMRAEGWRFDIDPAGLVPLGEAQEATFLVHPLVGPEVWELPGLDTDEYVVMHSADGTYVLFVAMGTELREDVDAVLCRHAIGDDRVLNSHCDVAP